MLFLLYTMVFFLIHAAPGGPWDSTKPIPPSVRDNLLKFYHLDEPIWNQFTTYLWNLIAYRDMGPTFRQPNRTVNDVLVESLSISTQLGLAAMVLAILLGISIGVISSYYRGSLIDNAISVVSSVSLSVPEYVTIPLFVLILALALHLVPTAGWDTIFSVKAIVPILGLAIRPAASIARYTRSNILDILKANYIVTARAKGLSHWMVMLKHSLPNALMPIVTVIGTHSLYSYRIILCGNCLCDTRFRPPFCPKH